MITSSLDFDKPGKQQGFLQVPYSHNLGGWANVLIPTTSISNRKGPTALVLAGNHGDEYQGQIAIMKLARELTPGMVTGRIILTAASALGRTGANRRPFSRRHSVARTNVGGFP